MAGKVLAGVILRRLLAQVVYTVMPKSVLFSAWTQHCRHDVCRPSTTGNASSSTRVSSSLSLTTKAFDTVNRELRWKVLSKFGYAPHLFQILREFHDGMSARVTVGGHVVSGVRSSSCRSTLPQAPLTQPNSNWSQMSAVCLHVWPANLCSHTPCHSQHS